MKTVFIVNPKARKRNNINKLISSIADAAIETGADIEGYVTKAIGNGRRFVKEYCHKFGAARFIACGGDGTLNEVLNGAVNFDGAEVGVIPIGTVNNRHINVNIIKNVSRLKFVSLLPYYMKGTF